MPRPARASKSKAIAAIKKMFKKRPRRRNVNVNKALSPFAQRYITKLKYSDTFTLSTTNSGAYYFNLNSLWDPNRTGIGRQPYGFDQLAALYNRYRVINCSYVITAYSGGSVVRVAAIPMNEQWAVIPSLSTLCENPRARFMIQIPGGNTKMIKGSTYLPSLVGRNKAQYMADDRYQAQTNTSPAELALLGVFGADVGDLSATITCTITLQYTVEFFDVINQTSS